MGMPGPKKVSRYGVEFKLKAVAMSQAPGVQVKDVAESLCIHPFMLSKWRRQVRDGVLVGRAEVPDPVSVAELKRLRELEVKYQRLQTEHDLLKKVIRFASERKAKSSPSSRQTGKPGRSG
jgi:transposase